jgi:hypothetical protein
VQRSRFAHHAFSVLAGFLPLPKQRATEPARSLAEAAALEAQKVRDLASTYAKTEPGFAADLYAAAARHEGLHAD